MAFNDRYLQEKVEGVLNHVGELGICADEAAALREDADGVDHASKALDSAEKNRIAAGVTTGGSVAALVVCTVIAETGVGLVVCAIAGATGAGGGAFWYDSADTAVGLAEYDLSKACDKMQKSSDALCKCIMSHMQE